MVHTLVFVAVVATQGCRPGQVVGVDSGGTSWTIASDDPIPGIQEGSVSVVTLRLGPPAGVTVAVWTDVSHRNTSGSAGNRLAYFEGSLVAADGRTIKYRGETSDGTVANVTIDGTSYDSTKGALFLIAARADKLSVKQVLTDVSKLPRGAALRDYALDNPEVATFFMDAHGKKTPEAEN